MALKSYNGSCHCGAVRFQADIDFEKGSNRCNCSICAKVRAWFAIVVPENFRQLQGEDSQTEYQWSPPGHDGKSNLHYHFCKICGVRTAGRGDHGPSGGPFYFIPVAALDNATEADLISGPIRYMDGKHDRYNRAPKNTEII